MSTWWTERTFDTIFGAVLGFLLALLASQLQRRADRKEQEAKAKKSKAALAKALAKEIHSFANGYLEEVRQTVNEVVNPTGNALQPFRVYAPTALHVFLGNTSRVGEFSAEAVQAVVNCYTSALDIVNTVELLKASYLWEIEQHGRVEDERADCVKQFNRLKGLISQIDALVKTAQEQLAKEEDLSC